MEKHTLLSMGTPPGGLTISESDEQDVEVSVSRRWFLQSRGQRAAQVVAFGSVLLLVASLIMRPSLEVDDMSDATFQQKLPPQLNVMQLLESDELRMAVEGASMRMAQIALRFPSPELGAAHGTYHRGAKVRQLSGSETKRLRKEAALGLRASLKQLLEDYPEAGNMFRKVNITGAQGTLALSMLRGFTDERAFDLGMEIGRATFHNTSHSRKPASIIRRLQRQARKHASELHHLREEFIPASLRNLRDDKKQLHVNLLRKKGFFHVHGDMADWSADLTISKGRRLQSEVARPAGTSEYNFRRPSPMLVSTSVPPSIVNVATQARNALVAPLNWFTVGAPTASSLVGLVLLSLTALLPGRGGFPRNNPAQFGLWGVQGAATLGDCFANLGFPTHVVYFAPCMIDIMFFGFDVAWVFFDGQPHNFPEEGIRCAHFSQWPVIENSACGNCIALVPTEPFGGLCSRYCESFGHRCVFAAEQVDDQCQSQSRYGCGEEIAATVDMLCQCKQNSPIQGSCLPYSQWPNILDTVCGNCTALVDFNPFGSCSDYCESFGHRCIDAQEETLQEECANDLPQVCDEDHRSSDVLCTCELVQPTPQSQMPCDWYSHWPLIVDMVCGNCAAIVPANGPVYGIDFTNCNAFCGHFGHQCVSAHDVSSCFDVDDDTEIACNQQATLRFQYCQCILPGRAALLAPSPPPVED